mmetsp:Transcript_156542/g.502421  ORF Transcript_156542/g.502421 Transcript_156542/m.502421 type:complete len:253 (+) Transcript_156542:501-1259(+)
MSIARRLRQRWWQRNVQQTHRSLGLFVDAIFFVFEFLPIPPLVAFVFPPVPRTSRVEFGPRRPHVVESEARAQSNDRRQVGGGFLCRPGGLVLPKANTLRRCIRPETEVFDDLPRVADDPQAVRLNRKGVANCRLALLANAIQQHVYWATVCQRSAVGRRTDRDNQGLRAMCAPCGLHRDLATDGLGVLPQLKAMVQNPAERPQVPPQLTLGLLRRMCRALGHGEQSPQVRGQEFEAEARPQHGQVPRDDAA